MTTINVLHCRTAPMGNKRNSKHRILRPTLRRVGARLRQMKRSALLAAAMPLKGENVLLARCHNEIWAIHRYLSSLELNVSEQIECALVEKALVAQA